jgi:hypothetical protein
MELAPLFLLLLLPPADATGELASAIEGSLRAELGDVAMAMVPDRLVTPAMLEGENPPYRANFVARVTWADRDKASIEVQSGRESKSATPYRASRVVTFSQRDRKAERGRTLGLVIAGLLRDSPPTVVGTAMRPATVSEPTHGGASLGGLFVVQRSKAGTWPVGPVFFVAWPLMEALDLRISAGGLFAANHWQLPMTVAGAWRFLRGRDDRLGAALALGVVVLRESGSQGSGDDHAGNTSLWNAGGVLALSGHVTLGRALRLLAQVELQALARRITVQYGEEPVLTTAFSRWRPAFGLGLSYSM